MYQTSDSSLIEATVEWALGYISSNAAATRRTASKLTLQPYGRWQGGGRLDHRPGLVQRQDRRARWQLPQLYSTSANLDQAVPA